MAQYGFYFDSSRCTGCKTCSLACKDFYDISVDRDWRRIYEYGGGDWEQNKDGTWEHNVFSYYTSLSCNHCDSPACVKACPTGAMHKREQDGLVAVDQDRCIGCQYCSMACPYGALQYDAEKKVMSKCHGCYERVAEGSKPVCVDACPLRALDFGPIDELRAKYGSEASIAPLPDAGMTSPNLVIKPNVHSKPSGDKSGSVQNSREVK
ncbi:DMSO/selenate family reductase complex B subunit [Endozoicomonas ascidiicola]|uniref:DMSO/selenate family reductase complex B subunit n=1 Tax=Endozoicomonas ascidiicola TaxID=1698521 RepID=UPI0008315533|nr:DMSO/selenate family reductase complex B subunit [Endozoicomonas ascidiicola]